MNDAREVSSPDVADPAETSTGLPWPRTWRGAYFLVLACFVFWLGFLILLTFVYP